MGARLVARPGISCQSEESAEISLTFPTQATFGRLRRNVAAGLMNLPNLLCTEVPQSGCQGFLHLLRSLYGEALALDTGDRVMSPHLKVRMALRGPVRRFPEEVRCIWGHFLAPKYDRLYPAWKTAMWFRDPVERTAAQYHLWRETPHPTNPAYQAMVRDQLTLEQFAMLPQMRNVYSRILDGKRPEALDFVGMTEDYPRSLELFRQLFRVHPWPQVAPDLEVTPVAFDASAGWRVQRFVTSEHVRATIEAANSEDMALYERARHRFEELVETRGVPRATVDSVSAPDARSPPLIFVHIPKTAGTSFAQVLMEVHGKGFLRSDGDDPWTAIDHGVTCIAGHFSIGRFRLRFPSAEHAVWFRDPVERVISDYEHWKRNDLDNPLWREFRDTEMSLLTFAAWHPARNLQHRLMLHYPVERLAYVGIAEEFDRSIRLFAKMFRVNGAAARAGPTNVNPEKRVGVPYDVGPLNRRVIESLNALDAQLYARARARFSQLCAEHGV